MLLPLKAVILKKPRKDGKFLIYYQYCFSSTNRKLLSTEIAIPSAYWNKKRQFIASSLPAEMGDHIALNNELSRIKKIIEAIIEHGQTTGVPNMGAYVKGLFKPDFKMESLKQPSQAVPMLKKEPDFFSEMESYITSKKKKVCEKGIGNFRDLQERMLAFEAFRKEKITFSSLDFNFYNELVEFFTYNYQHRHRKKPVYGLKISSIGKTIKQLRMFVKDRVRRKVIAPIDMSDFKILDEEADAIYLTYEEIGKIYSVDLTDTPALSLYRDMFVLGSLTGLRFSDYSTLSGSDLRGGMLYKKTNKMDSWVVIPLRKEAAEIFSRHYKHGVPKISNSIFNVCIKQIAALAGLDQPITFSYKKGNKDIVVTKPKAEWVTSHTCRRSFCTNEYLAGTDINLIMKISGHKTYKDFFKYIRVTQEEAAQKIRAIWEARGNMQAFSLGKTA